MDAIPQNRVALAIRIFTGSKPLEQSSKKDLSEFTKDELLNFYSYLDVRTPSILRDIHCLTKDYYTFNKANRDDIDKINIKVLRTKVNKIAVRARIISREDLLSKLKESEQDRLFNPSDAFIVLGFFEGLGNADYLDLQHITLDDMYNKDGQYYAKLYSGRTVKISNELYDYAERSCLTEIRKMNYRNNGVRLRELQSENPRSIIKYLSECSDEPEEIIIRRRKKTIYVYMQCELKICNIVKTFSTANALRMSGIIDHIKKTCKENGTNYDWYFERILPTMAEQYNISDPRNFRTLLRDYLEVC